MTNEVYEKGDLVILKDKRYKRDVMKYQGESNWAKDHSVLLNTEDGYLEHFENSKFRKCTAKEKASYEKTKV